MQTFAQLILAHFMKRSLQKQFKCCVYRINSKYNGLNII